MRLDHGIAEVLQCEMGREQSRQVFPEHHARIIPCGPQGILCTGHGWRSIQPEPSPNATFVDPRLRLVDTSSVSGGSLNEFRLRVGFLLFPVPHIGMSHSAAVDSIARSHEMKNWSIGGSYDRPIQRRLVEEAGVPRGLFGQSKKASAHVRISSIDKMTATSQADYCDFYVSLRNRAPKLRRLKARARHSLVRLHYKMLRFSPRHRLPAFGIGRPPTRKYQRLDIRRPWEIHFTMHWGHERIRHRYLEGEPHASGPEPPHA